MFGNNLKSNRFLNVGSSSARFPLVPRRIVTYGIEAVSGITYDAKQSAARDDTYRIAVSVGGIGAELKIKTIQMGGFPAIFLGFVFCFCFWRITLCYFCLRKGVSCADSDRRVEWLQMVSRELRPRAGLKGVARSWALGWGPSSFVLR